MVKLSIIIPCYNAEPYIDELLKVLLPQTRGRSDIEVIVVDDGSRFPYLPPCPGVKLIRKENGGVSSARNVGLENASGEYIAFIDADDLVAGNYISKVMEKIEEGFDYCYISWKAFGCWNIIVQLSSIEDKFPAFNVCVWNRIYKRSLIGDVRFNEKKVIAEDAEFIRAMERGKRHSSRTLSICTAPTLPIL